MGYDIATLKDQMQSLAKGDVPGHEFRGNQYTNAQVSEGRQPQTEKQRAGLAKLKQMAAVGFKPEMISGKPMIRTGVNTSVLHALAAQGFISASRIYLGGIVVDLKIKD